MPRRYAPNWRAKSDGHVCGRCRQQGHSKLDCCHRLLWVDLPLDGSADLFKVGGRFTNDTGDRAQFRLAPTVKLPLLWINYFVTAEVLSFVTWGDVILGDWVHLNRSFAAAVEPLVALRFRSGAGTIFEGPAVVPRPVVPFSDGTLFALPPRIALRLYAKHTSSTSYPAASSAAAATRPTNFVQRDNAGESVIVGYLPLLSSLGGLISRRDQLADRDGTVLVQGARSVGFTQRLVRVVDAGANDSGWGGGNTPTSTAANTRLLITHVRRAGRESSQRCGDAAAPTADIVSAYLGVFRCAEAERTHATIVAMLGGATVSEAEVETPPVVRL